MELTHHNVKAVIDKLELKHGRVHHEDVLAQGEWSERRMPFIREVLKAEGFQIGQRQRWNGRRLRFWYRTNKTETLCIDAENSDKVAGQLENLLRSNFHKLSDRAKMILIVKQLRAYYKPTREETELVTRAIAKLDGYEGVPLKRIDFLKSNISAEQLESACGICYKYLTSLPGFEGNVVDNIARVLRRNIDDKVDRGGNILPRDVYDWLVHFDEATWRANGDYNEIVKKQMNEHTEKDYGNYEGIKTRRNPMKLKERDDWFWAKQFDEGLKTIKTDGDFYFTAVPFGNDLQDAIERNGPGMMRALVHKAAKTWAIRSSDDIANMIVNAYNSLCDPEHKPSDKELYKLIKNRGEHFVPSQEEYYG